MAKTASEDVRVSKILEKEPNRFVLSLAVAMRARQIKEGIRPLVKMEEPIVPIIAALLEIEQGKVGIKCDEKASEEIEMIDKMDEALDAELSEEEKKEKESKKGDKEGKRKSKSLAA